MNPWQMAQQIKYELQRAVWAAGSQEVVFGDRGVVVTAGGEPSEEQIPKGFPFALVNIDTGAVDASHPQILEQQFTVLSAVNVAGDAMGEHAVIGGATAELGHSAGRGAAEVGERVRNAVQDLTGYDGAKVILSSSATGAPTKLGRGAHLAMDELTLTAICSSQPHYAAPQQLSYSGSSWTWIGAHCESRYDFLTYRLVGRAGVEPPATPEDGSVVYTGTQPQAGHVRNEGWSYTVFADYGSRGRIEDSSEAVTGATYAATAVNRRVYGYSEAQFTRDTSTTAYSTYDTVGSILTFENCAWQNGGSGCWEDFLLTVDGYSDMGSLMLLLFERYPSKSTFTDNQRFQVHEDDLVWMIGRRFTRHVLPMNKGFVTALDDDLYGYSSHDPLQSPEYPSHLSYVCPANSTNLYGVLVSMVDQSVSPVASSVWRVRLLFERD